MNSKHRTVSRSRRLARTVLVAATLAGVGVLGHATAAAEAQAPAKHQAAAHATVDHTVLVVDNTTGWHGLQRVMRAYNHLVPEVHMVTAKDCAQDLHAYCVVVDSWDQGNTWGGLTTRLTDRIAHVQLNVNGDPSPRLQTSIACHELAHALGADHPDSSTPADTRGCIAAVDHAHTTVLPTVADVQAVYAQRTGFGALVWQQVSR